jgi:hypothetical protein
MFVIGGPLLKNGIQEITFFIETREYPAGNMQGERAHGIGFFREAFQL